jgi:hypothetical protein
MKRKIILTLVLFCLLIAEFPLSAKANFSPNQPYIMPLSPRNYIVYNTSQPLVNITIIETFDSGGSREAYYILDGQDKVSIPLVYKGMSNNNETGFLESTATGTTILPKLSNGTHTIQFFARYYGAELGSSQVITFRIEAVEDNILPLYCAIILLALIPLISVLFYRRRKRQG